MGQSLEFEFAADERIHELRIHERTLSKRVTELETLVCTLVSSAQRVKQLEATLKESQVILNAAQEDVRRYRLDLALAVSRNGKLWPGQQEGKLAPRLQEVLDLLHQGKYTSKEIATALGISTSTACMHVARLMDIFGIRSRYQL